MHDEFKNLEFDLLRTRHPNTKILVHPEPPESVVTQVDVAGSTSQLAAVAQSLSAQEFIVTADNDILHKMHMAVPDKRFIEAPTAGNAVTCKSRAHYPWMTMNALTNLAEVLETSCNEIHVDPAIERQTVVCVDRVLDSAARKEAAVRPQSDLTANAQLFQGIGPV